MPTSAGPTVAATKEMLQHQGKELSIPRSDALDTLRHDRELKRAVLGIPFPVVYFCLFVAMLSQHIPTSDLYEQGYSVASVLASSGTDAITSATTMKYENIQTQGDIFDWLIDTFIPSVFVTEDYNGATLTQDKWGRIAMFNKVLGAVFFQTTRAAIHPCSAAKFLTTLYPNCYDPDHVSEDSFLISFDTNATEATKQVRQLKAKGTWLDFSTQQLLITVVAYNGEVQGYTVSKLQLDFHQGGYIELSSTTTPTISDPYKHTAAIVLDIIIAVCVIGSLVGPLSRVVAVARQRQQWRRVLLTWDVVLELASPACVAAFYGVWFTMIRLMYAKEFRDNLARLVVTGKTFAADSDERSGLVAVTRSLEKVAELTIALRLLATACVVALGVRILMQFRFHPRLNILTRTVAHALHQFAAFFVVFVVIFMTFSVAGMVLFGDSVAGFATLADAMESCVNMLFGNFDYASIQGLQRPVGTIYYWLYMVVVCLVLLNMMLAIVLDAYEETNQQAAAARLSLSFQRTFANIAYDWRAVLRRGGRGGVVQEGRVVPWRLEAALRQTKASVVAESTLMELFKDEKLTREDARRTLQYLLKGVAASDPAVVLPVQEEKEDGSPRVAAVAPFKADVELADVLQKMTALEAKLDLLLHQQQQPKCQQ